MKHLFEKMKPKEDKFFSLLHQMGEIIVAVSDQIIDCVKVANHDDAQRFYKSIKDLEHKADQIQNEIFEELNNTFITPFDREDINDLSAMMDDVVDLITSCSKRIMLYNPKHLPDSAVTLAMLVRDAAGYLLEAVNELASFKKRPERIKSLCASIEEVEKKADDVYEHFLINLFENNKDGKDAIEVIKLKDILHELERAADAAQSVGKRLKTVIIKFA